MLNIVSAGEDIPRRGTGDQCPSLPHTYIQNKKRDWRNKKIRAGCDRHLKGSYCKHKKEKEANGCDTRLLSKAGGTTRGSIRLMTWRVVSWWHHLLATEMQQETVARHGYEAGHWLCPSIREKKRFPVAEVGGWKTARDAGISPRDRTEAKS